MKCSICDAVMTKSDNLSKKFDVDGRIVTIDHLSGWHCKCCDTNTFMKYDERLITKIAHVLNNEIQFGYFNVSEVVEITKWSPAKIYTQLYDGKFLGAYKFDNRWRIPRNALINLGFTLSNSEPVVNETNS